MSNRNAFLRRVARVLAVVFSLVFVVTGCGGQQTAQPAQKPAAPAPAPSANQDYVIALMAPFTGDLARFGKQFTEGIALVIDEVNAKGGVNGRKITVKQFDDRGDPTEAANVAQKIVNMPEVVAVLGSYGSSATFAAQPIFDKAQYLNITPSASHADLMKKSKFTFRVWSSVPEYQGYLADFTVNKLGKKKVAVIYSNSDWGKLCGQSFVASVKASGGQVVIEQACSDGDKDFRSQLAKIVAAKPDVIHAATYYTEGALILKQLRDMGSKIPVVSTGVWMEDEFLKLAGKAADGLIFNTEFHPAKPEPAVADFVKKFAAKYGANVTPAQCHVCSYDAARLLVQALEKAGGASDRNKLRDTLEATKDFPGVTGTLSFNANREISKKTVFVTVADGKFQLYNK